MHNDSVTAFLSTIAHDDEILQQLVKYAAKRGYEFSVSDLKSHLAEALGDRDLESQEAGDAKKRPAKKKVVREGAQLPDGMLNI